MPSKNSNISFQQFNKIPSTIVNLNEENPINNASQEKKDSDLHHQPHHHRRLPLPTKLTFEQNITNLIEKESPLLQSELLTAEHELSVLRSRLAVNEGVTAVTGTILESLKGQFSSHQKVDSTTSPLDISKSNLLQQSSAMQTSPVNENLPDSLEIHYDAESPKSPYIVIKTKNSFWIAQPLGNYEVQKHLDKFSSPTMKRATIRLPDSFDFSSDSDDNDNDQEKNASNNNSISEEDESVPIDRYEQLSEMKTIRSSSLFQNEDQFEKFDNKLDEVYLIIDHLKHNPLTTTISNNLRKKIQDLKLIILNIHLNKQDELRIEYELDELETLCTNTFKHDDYNLIELFEQNLNELQHLIEQIKTTNSPSHRDLIAQFEDQLELIQNIDEETSPTESKLLPKQTHHPRLIPENPVVTSDVFFEGDKTSKCKKSTAPQTPRLIPEDARISASSFYEGDIHRSLYHPTELNKETENSIKMKSLIPEKPLVSSEVFYEGDAQRSMFSERSLSTTTESSPPISIDNLRQIMSDLMLAASWSKKPAKLEKQSTKDEEEILAESFITTERRYSRSSLCEIIHEIENLPASHSSMLVEEQQINKTLHPTILEEDETIQEKSPEPEEHNTCLPNDVTLILVSPPSFEQEDDDEQQSNEENFDTYQTLISDQSDSNIISNEEHDVHSTDYEARLLLTSNDVVEQILNDAISETLKQDEDQLYYQTAVTLVQNAMETALLRYSSELNLSGSSPSSSPSSSSISDSEEENSDGYSSTDDEENENLIPEICDQPYLFVNDVVTSRSSQELGDLVQELQILEGQIHRIRSISSSSSSDNEQIQSMNLSIPQIIRTKSVNDLSNLVSELQNVEEQLEDTLSSPLETIKSPISSQSFNELGGLINELHTVSKQLNNRIYEEIFISNNINSLSEDIIKYRRDSLANPNEYYSHQIERQPSSRPSSPLLQEQFVHITCTSMHDVDQVRNQLEYEQLETQVVHNMVDDIIQQAQDIMTKESLSNIKSMPTVMVAKRSSITSISDDVDLSHEDNIADKTFELAAQLDYLRRMSRYENLTDQLEQYTLIHSNLVDNNEELKSTSYLTMVYEEPSSSDDDNRKKSSIQQQQMNISQDSVTQPSSDSLDYHSTETEINQIPMRRTASDNSLHSTSSSIHTYEPYSVSTSCLIDKDESTIVNEQNLSESTANIGFFDRVKLFVSKPVEIVQEAMENFGKQRTSETDISSNQQQQQQQHFQSAHDLHDEEKSKLVRSPELYNIDNVIKHHHKSLLTSTQIQYRTLSESALITDDSKRHSLTTSNEASTEFLTAISKENSMEFIHQRLSTPFDDVLEKESSPEQSESYLLPTTSFSDAFEPTSSCQRPLAFHVPGQQRSITDEEFYIVANDLVNQVLNDVICELTGEQEDSSISNINDKYSISSTSSDDDDKIVEVDEEEYVQNEFYHSPTTSYRSPSSKILRRAQTDTKHFNIAQSPIALIPPMMRRNSQSDTEVYFRAVSPSVHEYRQMENVEEKCSNSKRSGLLKPKENYSDEGEESSETNERTILRRKRSTDQTNIYESPSIKISSYKSEFNDYSKRRESLDSPQQDTNEHSLLKCLQEGILRTNLEYIQIDLKLTHEHKDKLEENIYSSMTKRPVTSDDYDAGSDTDHDETKFVHSSIVKFAKFHQTSIDIDTKNLLEELVQSINDDLSLSTSISSELVSSQSDATTVILNSNKHSMDDNDETFVSNHDLNQNDQQYLAIQTSSSSSSSSHSVIYQQQTQLSQMKTNLTTGVNTKSKKQLSAPSFSDAELIGHCTKKKFRSYPGSLGGIHLSSSPITSIPNDYYTMTTTSTTFKSGN